MVFSEPVFLFVFLPFFLLAYFAVGAWGRNWVLLAASLAFYAWGEEIYVLILIASISLNYAFGLAIAATEGAARKWMLGLGVAANLGLLIYYKYFGFLLENLGFEAAAANAPLLPIGISFFTFQALSYLIDLNAGAIAVQRNPFRLGLFISMFPQLIAGPIVRYAEVEKDLVDRRIDRGDFAAGVRRFVLGLAKKTLIADPLGLLADEIYAIPAGGLSPEVAWLGAVAYSLQLFFDFSAYSDMAIGLGRMLGFKFPENFNYPYAARSVAEFWRRWHMTLSRWFRDYLYIPLGGNRVGAFRTYLNLWLVFMATGVWHGAAWSFLFWGMFHGALLIAERIGLGGILTRLPRPLAHLYLLLAVIIGWVLFRAEDMAQTLDFYEAMFLFASGPAADFHPVGRYLDGYLTIILLIGAVLSVPSAAWLQGRAARAFPTLAAPGREALFWALLIASVASVGAASYSPFIYFRF